MPTKLRIPIVLLCTFFYSCNSIETSVFKISDDDRAVYERLFSEPDSIQFFTSFDLTKIAYREFIPDSFSTVVIFIHGTAAQSKLYLPFADTLLKNGIATILPDLRGHGLSGAERGDAKNSTALARDLKLLLDTVRAKFKGKQFILGGHSLGAGVCLKYIEYFYERPSHYHPPDAFFLMSGGYMPDPNCDTKEIEEKKKIQGSFAKSDGLASLMILPDIFLDIHPKLVEIILPNDKLVTKAIQENLLTVNYSLSFFLAAFPFDIERIYQQLLFPTACFIGTNDELIKVCDARYSFKKIGTKEKTFTELNANHVNIIWNGAEAVVNWIKKLNAK